MSDLTALGTRVRTQSESIATVHASTQHARDEMYATRENVERRARDVEQRQQQTAMMLKQVQGERAELEKKRIAFLKEQKEMLLQRVRGATSVVHGVGVCDAHMHVCTCLTLMCLLRIEHTTQSSTHHPHTLVSST